METRHLQAINGLVSEKDLGLILPHEHLFTDLRGPAALDYAREKPENVVRAMMPRLDAAHQKGVTALVECSTGGVGRNVQVLKAIGEATPIQIIAPTGVYRDAYIPENMRDLSAEEMADLWIDDLVVGMEGTELKAGFIKIAMSDDGPLPIEETLLRAAVIASRQTGAVVASHTANGEVFKAQWQILEKAGLPPENFIWVHANLEQDNRMHLDAAKIGVFVEFDGVGAEWQSQDAMVRYTVSMIEAGFLKNILLSHDAGWYQPGRPNGEPEGGYRGYTDLVDDFIPRLFGAGVSQEETLQITHDNPVSAFAFG